MTSASGRNSKKRAPAPPPAAASTHRVEVRRSLTIYEAMVARDELMASLAHGAAIELDLSGVSEIDTAGIQLLLLARRECTRQGRTLRIAERSRAVQELIDFYDLAAQFEAPSSPAADSSPAQAA